MNIRRSTLAVLLFALSAHTLFARQDEAKEATKDSTETVKPKFWKLGGALNLNFNQVSLSNWSGGGNSSIAVGGLSNFYAEYEKEQHRWESRANFAYGVLRQGERGNRVQKTDDQLILISRYRYRISKKWSVSTNMDFRTQFDDGFRYNDDGTNTLLSTFMSPAYLLLNIGGTYRYQDILSLTLSPLSSRNTFVLDNRNGRINPTNYGLESIDDRYRFQGGVTLILSVRKELMENINFNTNINFFSDYENMWPIDIAGEALLTMKVNKLITASISSQFIYDSSFVVVNEAGERKEGPLQLKNIFAIGFAYNFKNHKGK